MLYHNVRLVGTHLLVIDASAFSGMATLAILFAADEERPKVVNPELLALSLVLVAFVLFLTIGNRFGAYHARRTEALSREIVSLSEVSIYSAAFLSLVAFAIGLIIGTGALFSIIIFTTSGMVILRLAMRLAIRRWRREGKDDQIWLIVGGSKRAAALVEDVQRHRHYGIRIHEIVDLPTGRNTQSKTSAGDFPCPVRLLTDVEQIRDIIKQNVIDEIVITLPVRSFYDEIQNVISIGRETGISVMLQPDAFGQSEYKSQLTMTGAIPMVTHFTGPSNYVQLGIKRLIDILGASLGLILLSPFFVLIAVAIKLDSQGKVLFLSERTGLHGRKFDMVKFRSMVSEAPSLRASYSCMNETDGVAFKIRNDPRVTRVGRILRAYHLDELAQLWNVLVGDMSLVGPRPLPNDEAIGREWWHLRRLSMPPGLTCFWQVKGDHTMPFKEWVDLDLKYIDNWSVWLDVKLISRTVLVIFRRPGW